MTSALTAMTSFGVEAYFMARNFAKILQTPGYVTKISADVEFEFGAELDLIWIYKTELGLFSGECTLLHALVFSFFFVIYVVLWSLQRAKEVKEGLVSNQILMQELSCIFAHV